MNLRYSVKGGLQCGHERLFLQELRRRLRRFQNDFKGPRPDFRRGAQHAARPLTNDAVARVEAVDDRVLVARQDEFRRTKRRLKQVLGQGGAADVTINAVTGIVGMQRDQTVKGVRPNLALQCQDFRFDGIVPELAVQVPTPAANNVCYSQTPPGCKPGKRKGSNP